MKPSPPSPWLLTHVVICFLTLPSGVAGQTKADMNRLLTNLTEGYNRDIRPVNDLKDITRVLIDANLVSVSVNEKDQTIKTQAYLAITWKDSFLSWSKTEYGGIESVMLRQKDIWLPDIVIYNTATPPAQLGYEDLQVSVQFDGEVNWMVYAVMETFCDIDIKYYPFDTQKCQVIFDTSMSSSEEVDFLLKLIWDRTFWQNGLWRLADPKTEILEVFDLPCITLNLFRRHQYYIISIFIPIVFLSITAVMTFCLPCESEEKVNLSITVLLAYTVHLAVVTGSMPVTSIQVSLMTVYLLLQLTMATVSVICNVILQHIHKRTRPYSGCFATFIRRLRWCMCMYTPKERKQKTTQKKQNKKQSREDGMNGGRVGRVKRPPTSKIGENNRVFPADSKNIAVETTNGQELTVTVESKIAVKTKNGQELDCDFVSETLNRFLFIVFIIVSFGGGVILIILMAVGGYRQFVQTVGREPLTSHLQ